MTQDNYDKAIYGLNSAKSFFAEVLAEVPNLVLSSDTVFRRLGDSIRQAAAAAGLNVGIAYQGEVAHEQRKTTGELRHIAGRERKTKGKQGKLSDQLKVKMSDKQLFMNQAEEDLMDAEPRNLIDQYGPITLKGLAKRLGMDVEEGERVNVAFVEAMQAAKQDRIEKEIQVKMAEGAATSSEKPPAAVEDLEPALETTTVEAMQAAKQVEPTATETKTAKTAASKKAHQ